MKHSFDMTMLTSWAQEVYAWLDKNIFSLEALFELGAVLICAVGAFLASRGMGILLKKMQKHYDSTYLLVLFRILRERAMGIIFTISLFILTRVFEFLDLTNHLLRMFTSLAAAWVIIKLFSYILTNKLLRNTVGGIVWIAAALNTVGLFERTVSLLSAASVTFGETTISLYMVFKGVLVLIIMLWAARLLSGFAEKGLASSDSFSASMRALTGKVVKSTIYVLAVVFTLNTVGIDLTALAVFSGALGVGIGFGLQKVVANLVSGFILLLDNSIRPGDTIELEDKFGHVNSIGARYSSVTAWDGTEYLVPNEDFITNRVINWTHSNSRILIYLNIGVSYKSDMDLVKRLLLEAVRDIPRVVLPDNTRCFMKEFADSSVNFRLSFWIDDPENGIINVKSEVLFAVWNSFREHNIEIPFPQCDVHMKGTS